MQLIDVLYMLLMPIVLLLAVFGKNKTIQLASALLIILNTSMIFYVALQCYQYYQLYQFANYFGMAPSLKEIWQLGINNKLQSLQNILLLLLPLCISITALRKNIYASLAMVLLLWLPGILALVQGNNYTLPLYGHTQLLHLILRVVSTYIAIWGWWLLKRKIVF